jgi:hypothetical protein
MSDLKDLKEIYKNDKELLKMLEEAEENGDIDKNGDLTSNRIMSFVPYAEYIVNENNIEADIEEDIVNLSFNNFEVKKIIK